MNQSKTYFLLMAIILSVTVSCKKDEMSSNLLGPPLQVHAGHDTIVNLPATALRLYGTVIMGSTTKLNWRQISGPSCRIQSPEQSISGLTVMETGVYVFEFTATNPAQVKAFDSVEITVKPSIDTLQYVAIYPSYHLLNLPQNSVTLTAYAGNHHIPGTPGNIASIQWRRIAGPASYHIDSPFAAQTRIANLEEGIYQFSCTMTSTTGFVRRSFASIAVANPSSPSREIILHNQEWVWDNYIQIDIYNHVPSGKPIKKVFLKRDCHSQWRELGLNAWPEIEEWGYDITSTGIHLIIHDYVPTCGVDTPDVKIVY